MILRLNTIPNLGKVSHSEIESTVYIFKDKYYWRPVFQSREASPGGKSEIAFRMFCLFAFPVALISTRDRELTFIYQAFQTSIFHAVPDKPCGSRGSPQKVCKAWPHLIHKNSSGSVCLTFYFSKKSFCSFKKQNLYWISRAKREQIPLGQIKMLYACSQEQGTFRDATPTPPATKHPIESGLITTKI